MERRIELTYRRERRCKHLLDQLDEMRGAGILK
jgi:hypothetical protein